MTPSDEQKGAGSGAAGGASATIITTRTGTTRLREDGILYVDTHPDLEMTLSDAHDTIRAQATLAAGVKRPLVVNVKKIRALSREARVYLAGKEGAKNLLAMGLVMDSHLGRVIGNFFIGINKTEYPTRLFTDEDEAFAWVRTFLPGK